MRRAGSRRRTGGPSPELLLEIERSDDCQNAAAGQRLLDHESRTTDRLQAKQCLPRSTQARPCLLLRAGDSPEEADEKVVPVERLNGKQRDEGDRAVEDREAEEPEREWAGDRQKCARDQQDRERE